MHRTVVLQHGFAGDLFQIYWESFWYIFLVLLTHVSPCSIPRMARQIYFFLYVQNGSISAAKTHWCNITWKYALSTPQPAIIHGKYSTPCSNKRKFYRQIITPLENTCCGHKLSKLSTIDSSSTVRLLGSFLGASAGQRASGTCNLLLSYLQIKEAGSIIHCEKAREVILPFNC